MSERVMNFPRLGAQMDSRTSYAPSSRSDEASPRSESGPNGKRRRAPLEYQLLLGVTFGFFLLATIAEAFVPFRRKAEAGRREGVIRQAWCSARTCVNYAFMG